MWLASPCCVWAAEPEGKSAAAPAVLMEPAVQIVPIFSEEDAKRDTEQPTAEAQASASNGQEEGPADEPTRPAAADLEMAPQVGAAATLMFRASVEITHPRLALGDLASCNGTAQVCDEAYGVDLGPSPEAGRTQLLHLDHLKQILLEEWPTAALRLSGPKTIKVIGGAASVGDGSVAAALKEALHELFAGDDHFVVTVEKVTLSGTQRLKPGDQHLAFPELTAEHAHNPAWVRKSLNGTQRVAVVSQPVADEEGDAEAAARPSFTISVQLNLKEKLPVPSHDLVKGDVLAEEDLDEQLVELPRGAQVPVAALSDLVGRRLKRNVAADTPLTAAMVEVPKVVHRGQLVRLVIHAKGLDVASQVVAQSDAGFGQQIEAVYPATKKRLRVRVIDSSTVEYVF